MLSTIKIDENPKHPDTFTALSHVHSNPQNRKIGKVAQTWHLTNEKPSEAYKNGNDEKVCGDCPLRSPSSGGNGTCYVVLIHGPNGVHSSHMTLQENQPVNQTVQPLPDTIGKPIRFGAYGDPILMPIELVRKLASKAQGHIGYTHQWQTCDPAYSEFLMASIDPAMAKRKGITTAELAQRAKHMGWRTFRILEENELPLVDEIQCLNETHGIQCDKCLMCNGSKREMWELKGKKQPKSITIYVHGTGAGNVSSIELAKSN
jgi:hypothetical protein